MTTSISPVRLEKIIRSRWVLPDTILDELAQNPDFVSALRANVGVLQVFTLRTHTLSVMNCYEKYFAPMSDADPRARGLFRLFLALHDIGKPLAIEAGDKRLQHRFTVDLLRQTRASYPVTDREFEDWIALVDGDPVGAYLKGEISDETAADLIRHMAARSSLTPAAFYRQLIVYYQCDTFAYTHQTGLIGILDGLFVWNREKDEVAFDASTNLLQFSDPVQKRLSRIAPERLWSARS